MSTALPDPSHDVILTGNAIGRKPHPWDAAQAPYVETAVDWVSISHVLIPAIPTMNVPTERCPSTRTPRVGPVSFVAQLGVPPLSGGMMPAPTLAATARFAGPPPVRAAVPSVFSGKPQTSV